MTDYKVFWNDSLRWLEKPILSAAQDQNQNCPRDGIFLFGENLILNLLENQNV
jgi:hypothetical protein